MFFIKILTGLRLNLHIIFLSLRHLNFTVKNTSILEKFKWSLLVLKKFVVETPSTLRKFIKCKNGVSCYDQKIWMETPGIFYIFKY
jgi:hypothetical protein